MLQNGSFSEGWDDMPPTSFHLINQQPKGWTLRWLEVGEIRGHVVDAKVDHWQVGVKLGFTLEQADCPETLEEKHQHDKAEEAVTRAVGGKALH